MYWDGFKSVSFDVDLWLMLKDLLKKVVTADKVNR
jgi:hypothetical protein